MSVAVPLAASVSSSLSAQLVPGGRIRVGGDLLGTHPVVANLVAASPDSLVFRPVGYRSADPRGDTLYLPRSALKRLEVPNGTFRETKKGAWSGLFGGMLLGGIIGYATYEPPPPCNGLGCLRLFDDSGTRTVLAGLGGGILGVIGGAVLGHNIISDRWVPVGGTTPARVSITPRRDGVALQLSLSVR
jgi:hypothetical protein